MFRRWKESLRDREGNKKLVATSFSKKAIESQTSLHTGLEAERAKMLAHFGESAFPQGALDGSFDTRAVPLEFPPDRAIRQVREHVPHAVNLGLVDPATRAPASSRCRRRTRACTTRSRQHRQSMLCTRNGSKGPHRRRESTPYRRYRQLLPTLRVPPVRTNDVAQSRVSSRHVTCANTFLTILRVRERGSLNACVGMNQSGVRGRQ